MNSLIYSKRSDPSLIRQKALLEWLRLFPGSDAFAAGYLFRHGGTLLLVITNKFEMLQTGWPLAPGANTAIVFIKSRGANMTRPGDYHELALQSLIAALPAR